MQQAYPLAARAAHFQRWALAAAALLLAVLLPGGAQATVYYVDVTRADNSGDGLFWSTAKKDVQAAINLATADGDQVWVKAGTYLPTLVPGTGASIPARDRAFYLLNADIKLYGGFAGSEDFASQRDPVANLTTLSGDLDATTSDAYHVLLTVRRTSACVIDGFFVQGGRANTTASLSVQPTSGAAVTVARNLGGGLYNATSSPTLSNCLFSMNTASSNGGGMYNMSSSPTLSSCTFSTNTAPGGGGGGMYNTGSSSPTLSSCTFSSNTASSGGGGGGGMYNNTGSSPTLSSCTFNSNRASGSGGGMYNNTGSSPTLSSCTFSSNTATGNGGGLYNVSSNPTLSSCTIRTNGAVNGGGLFNAGSGSPVLNSCIISSNTATNGGGLYNNTGSTPTLSNCTISSNTASSNGGGLYNTTSTPTLSNCTISSNTASSNGGGMNNAASNPTLSSCLFDGNKGSSGGGMLNNSSSPVMSGCTFSNNTSNADGGGMSNQFGTPTVSGCLFISNRGVGGGGMSNSGSSPMVSNCVFSANTASGGGGGMFNSSSSPTVSNCVFSANTTSGGGGGMSNQGPGTLTMQSCTFSGNSAVGGNNTGGGLTYSADAGGTLTNCILYQNTLPNNPARLNIEELYKAGNTATLTVSNCIVRDAAGTAPNLTLPNITLSNCFTTAPGYVDAADADGPDNTWATADDGLRLACGSFAVDQGTGSTPSTDLLGNPRKGPMDLGAYEATGGTAPADAIPAETTTVSGVQPAAALPYTDCQNQLLLLDATSPYTLLGSTIATVRVLATAPTFLSQPYVRRTYDIAPATNAATATAEVTLYFTQADFDDYNAARGTRPALPTATTDPGGNAANLRITQKHGSSSTGAVDSYTGWAGSGPATVFITPTAVTYNATAARWEVRYPVTGFSGFFAHTGTTPLPVELRAFTATPAGPAAVRLAWATASEKNSARFEVERSATGRAFERIGTVAGAGNSSARAYALLDSKLPTGAATLYYRLRLVDVDGTFSYSPVRTVALAGAAGLALFPNPAQGGAATLLGALPGAVVTVVDALGRPVTWAPADASGTAALALPAGLPAGVYVVRAGTRAVRLTVE